MLSKRVFRLFSATTLQMPKFGKYEEIVDFAFKNINNLKDKETFLLFQNIMKLCEPSKIKDNEKIYAYNKLVMPKIFGANLESHELILMAKYYSQMGLILGPDWKLLFKKIEPKLYEISGKELLEFSRMTKIPRNESLELPFWKLLLGEMIDKLAFFNISEIIEIMELACELEIKTASLWAKFEKSVSQNIYFMKNEDVMKVLSFYSKLKLKRDNIEKILNQQKLI